MGGNRPIFNGEATHTYVRVRRAMNAVLGD
jgi:hypothetical protein